MFFRIVGTLFYEYLLLSVALGWFEDILWVFRLLDKTEFDVGSAKVIHRMAQDAVIDDVDVSKVISLQHQVDLIQL